MAIFNNMSITTKGQVLYAKAQAGIKLNFTKMMVGSGLIGTMNPATLIALVDPKFDIGIQSITPNTELKTATIAGMINNSNVKEATYICEIGLFATDPNEGEILYAYGSAGKYGDYYAPASQGPYSWNYQINAAIGNAANVTVELSSLTYDYGVVNTNTTLVVLSGGNQKEINKSIDAQLSDLVYQVAGGTATAITLTMQTLINGYAKTFIASASNGGASTTINGKPVYKPGINTPPNFIKDKAYTVWYNSTGNCFFIKASAEGDADVSHVLATKKFSNDNDTRLVGTMPNNGALNKSLAINGTYTIPAGYTTGGIVNQNIPTKSAATITPGTTDQVISANQYLSGTQTVKGDANLVASNIISGKNIFGVNGTATVASLGGTKYATGTVTTTTVASTVYQYITNGIQGISMYYIDITGIGFTPKVIVLESTYVYSSYTIDERFVWTATFPDRIYGGGFWSNDTAGGGGSVYKPYSVYPWTITSSEIKIPATSYGPGKSVTYYIYG